MRAERRIDRTRIRNNLRVLGGMVGGCHKLYAVIKANAYGHGAVEVARICAEEGIYGLAVATVAEGVELREAGITLPVLVLGGCDRREMEEAIAAGLTLTVYSRDVADTLSYLAEKMRAKVLCEIKLDCGMARIGFRPEEDFEAVRAVSLPGLCVQGIYGHLSEYGDGTETARKCFLSRVHAIEKAGGVAISHRHLLSSGGILRSLCDGAEYARAGIALFGIAPDGASLPTGILPALSLRASVRQVKTVPPGTPVGYGGHFVTKRETVIATLPIGYADGLPRDAEGWEVIIRGKAAPVIGRVCMDMFMLDATGTGAAVGDTATVIGDTNPASALALRLWRIPYEILTGISPRVPIRYYGE